MILIVHDASDIMIAFGRSFVETKYATKNYVIVLIYIAMTSIWIFMRILVFPFCLLANVYANKPTPKDEWHQISFEYNYLLTMAFVLYGMHIFWTYFIIMIGVRSSSGKAIENVHENQKIKK